MMLEVADGAVDSILTSPPYLNAIDYLRGHRLSLIWLGHTIKDLRNIRSSCIGSERAADASGDREAEAVRTAMGAVDELPSRYGGMVGRFANDVLKMLREVARVLSPTGSATFVVGNSCLKGIFVHNSEAVVEAAQLAGLTLVSRSERELPTRHRYLPTPDTGMLGKRMKTETILTFVPAG
jgi:DNA modification methylase